MGKDHPVVADFQQSSQVRISCHTPKNGNENRRIQGESWHCERTKMRLPGFIGTDFAPQRMATEDFSESEGRDVAQRRREIM